MTRKRTNIGLIGFMGTGKTTIGSALADFLDWTFCDTDEIVENRAGKTISQIFSNEGASAFRKLECIVVKEICELETTVISFGGGAPLDPVNRRLIEKNSFVVLLKASASTIIARTSGSTERPLLNVHEGQLENKVNSLLNERNPAYTEIMDFELETDDLSVEEAVTRIVERLKL
ncbi:MAG: shikimate kinase [Promethearchaeia archaeon]